MKSPSLAFLASLSALWQVMCRTWWKALRRPVVLTFSLAQPLIWMAFFGFLFQRFRPPGEGAYLDFLAPGIAAMTVLFGASQSGVGLIRDLQTGFLPRLLHTPASYHVLLVGKVLADVLRFLVQATLVLGLAFLLGARFHTSWSALVPAVLGLALFAMAFSCVSCAIALETRTPEAMGVFVHLVNMPLLFTSTALVSSRQMPDWLANLSTWNPLTLTVDAWRGALLEATVPSPIYLFLLAYLTLLFYGIASALIRRIAALY